MWLFYILFFVFGLIVGSFLNVVVFRFGFKETRRPRSACSACNTQLSWYELIPVVSFVAQRGVCRQCGSHLSVQYPLVEGGVGLLFLLAAFKALPLGSYVDLLLFALTLFFISTFVVLTVYDIRHTLVPVSFAFILFVASILFRSVELFQLNSIGPLIDGFAGALALSGFIIFLVVVTRGKGMGAGDAYIAASVGMFLGLVRGIETITFAFWIGALWGLVFIVVSIAMRRFFPHMHAMHLPQGVRMKSEVPFVPFLFGATLLGMYTHLSPVMLLAPLLSL